MAASLLIGCANYQVNIFGVDITRDDAVVTLAGATASAVTHIAGHYLMAEAVGIDIHQEGFKETYESSPDSKWIDRGGFMLQIAVNGILIITTEDSYFTKGYTATTLLQLMTYPIRHPDDGDFNQ